MIFCINCANREIGAGIRVPTIRDQSHTILRTLRKAAILIRINPDFPVAPSDLEGQTISIMGNGLQSLQNIDKTLQALDSRIAPGYKVAHPLTWDPRWKWCTWKFLSYHILLAFGVYDVVCQH